MVDFPLRSVDKEVHQLKLITIITERGGVGGCSRNLSNPHGMFTGTLHQRSLWKKCVSVQTDKNNYKTKIFDTKAQQWWTWTRNIWQIHFTFLYISQKANQNQQFYWVIWIENKILYQNWTGWLKKCQKKWPNVCQPPKHLVKFCEKSN